MAGLAYALVRQLRRRRFLPAGRYRGPSIALLLALALVLAAAVTVPFTEDANALLFDGGTVSLPGAIAILTSTQLALLLVSWLFVFRPRAVALDRSLSGSEDWWRPLRAGFGWGLVAWIVGSVVTLAVLLGLDRLGLTPEPHPAERAIQILDPWLTILAVVVLAPVAEEVFFRGVAFNAWLQERGRRFAYIGSSALFAVTHLSLVSVLPIFLLGLAFAWVYRRTGHLLAPIAMHATVNGISVGVALLARFEVIRLSV